MAERQTRHDSWLPDFGALPVVLAMMVVAELVMLVIIFAPSDAEPVTWSRLTLGSLFVEWLAVLCVLALWLLRKQIAALPPARGVALAYVTVVVIVGLASAVVFEIDHGLGIGHTLPRESYARFVLGNIVVAGLVAAAAFRYFWISAQWQRGVRGEARAQVVALQARIQPHFLFNSMNTIASLIAVRPDDAERAVEDLSDLLRAALNAGEGLTTFDAEMELAQRYLDIEQLRLGEKLRLRVTREGVPGDFPMPSLLLQPLVENAVLHGVQAMVEGGVIELHCACIGEHLVITVRNPRPDPPVQRPGNRSAQDNVRQRMQYHYGDRGRLEVDAGRGYYAVKLTIPRL